MTPTTRRARESKLLMELQRDHGYMLAKMPREDDRYALSMQRDGKRMTMKSSVVVRLVVPEKSDLGRAMIRNYRAAERAKVKSKRSKRG